ncbi:hypothetical protein HDV01_006350 [Terramyces sp. JEL0728]|nr:hypothetical protein HDV01_006350 [Terramyces sp. JEL0728]
MVDFATVGPIIGVAVFVLLFGGLLLSFYLPEKEENMAREDSYHKMKRRITHWQPKHSESNVSTTIQMEPNNHSQQGSSRPVTPTYSQPATPTYTPQNAFNPPTPPAAYGYPSKVDIALFDPTIDATTYPRPAQTQGYNTISTNLPYTNNFKNYNELEDPLDRKSQSDVGFQTKVNSTIVNEYQSQVGAKYREDKPWEPVPTAPPKVYKVPELLSTKPQDTFTPPTLLKK